ncbi:hypothetical protein GCM10007304_40720 [Rhodococcoides trifolii]|uniref:Response regulatory domain-containing protein n=1 Tax=Rhodococcoides trifolii TaxID=908250 RepID=A0A917G4R4_9NOCA|nr:hypothetical protein GCM10007304_40720 [Rhodococcus trifolii]
MTDRRILVVDDEVTIAESIASRLRAEGFVVDIAGDGPTAVRMCDELRPDLVVLDVMLPGFEVCRRIEAQRPVAVLHDSWWQFNAARAEARSILDARPVLSNPSACDTVH